ncbi:MAG: putative intracellular protease/amidase [Oleiphilaceae bacterium]|jgi:putative intracellular protease/amidase
MTQANRPIKTIIIPLPHFDFDPTEVAIPWKILNEKGVKVCFATPDGKMAQADDMMLSGEGLDPWGWIPFIKKIRLLGLMLRADQNAREAYQALLSDPNFQAPCKYAALKVENFDGLFLPGGHAPRMKLYLESSNLQSFVADFFEHTDSNGQHKPIAAICHGVVLAARALSKKSHKSVLYGKKTTALTWDLENSAWKLTKYFARFWDSSYYRTYIEKPNEPKAFWSVEQEIKRALKSEQDFLNVPKNSPNYFLKTSGIVRDNAHNKKPAWVVRDGNYLSARWPGDAHTLALEFLSVLDV